MKIRPLGAELFLAEGWIADMTRATLGAELFLAEGWIADMTRPTLGAELFLAEGWIADMTRATLGAELFLAEGWIADMTRPVVACRSFPKAPETDLPCYSNALSARVSVSCPQQWCVYRSEVRTQ